MLSSEDKAYLISMLIEKEQNLFLMAKAIDSMGDHAFINEGLLNEGALKSQHIKREIAHIQRLQMVLKED